MNSKPELLMAEEISKPYRKDGVDSLLKTNNGEAPKKGAFAQLPDEIIQQILELTNPNSFASLTVLNTTWRKVSQQAQLYAHHLARCPSYAAAHPGALLPEDEASLPRLRRLFAREVKRNLFEAYLRPQETIINLVSISISSSSAPAGEAFFFSISPRGHYVLAYSSSRIHVLDVTGPEIEVKRELKILRRPASTTITDDGYTLAVLSTDLQVDLYDLRSSPPKHTRAVALDHTPRTIALSPTGSVLACAYDAGVEVSSLDNSPTNTDRRAVKCYTVDSLSFSQDGTQILGSTLHSRSPSTVVLTAPYYDPGGNLPEDSVSALWTTSILFPNGSRDCSHAVLLPDPLDGESRWTFTYDRVFETFRAVRIDDLRNGTTYFTGPIADYASTSKLLPSTLPAASECGDLVAAGFQGAIWLYGVPEDLDALPINVDLASASTDSESSTPLSRLGRQNSANSTRSLSRPRDSSIRTPQWQLLCDKFRNTFIEGRRIASLDQVSALSWVDDCSTLAHAERLVAVAPGVGCLPGSEDDGMSPVDGGRISLLDFKYSPLDGTRRFITVEVGAKEPEVLEEEHRDLDTEVAIVRRRTVAQRRGNRSHVSRSATTAHLQNVEVPPVPARQHVGSPFIPAPLPVRRPSQQTVNSEHSETASADEDQDAFDAPYSHTSPRSGTTLRRAATAAAVNRRLHPRAVAHEFIEYRRADGREEHPHESDADNWVPPPPPYTRERLPPLPEHIQRSLLAEAAAATLQRSNTQRSPTLDFPGLDAHTLHRSHTVATVASSNSANSRRERPTFQRAISDSAFSADRVSLEDESPRPIVTDSSGFGDLYDVSPQGSPPGTPPLLPITPVNPPPQRPLNSIPRRPVGAAPAADNQSQVTPGSANMNQHPISHNTSVYQNAGTNEVTATHKPQTIQEHIMEDEPLVEGSRNNPARGSNQIEDGSTNRHSITVPPRPDETHHLTELTPTFLPLLNPETRNQQRVVENEPVALPRRSETAPVALTTSSQMVEEPLPIWRRADTAPVAAKITPAIRVTQDTMVMPSADQLARLNSRKGRPAGLTDPRRVSGGSNSHQRTASGGHSRSPSASSVRSNPPGLTPEQTFQNRGPSTRAISGPHSSPSRHRYPSQGPPHHGTSPSRRLGPSSHHRSPSSGSPNLRPPMQRLETIHSQSSNAAEPSPFALSKAMMVSRQPSRAERSAAKNINDAKKKGWRASMKSGGKKDKYGDGASSAGWTDVTRESSGYDKKEKGGKCVVM